MKYHQPLGVVTWESDPALYCTMILAALPQMPKGAVVQRIEQMSVCGYTVWWHATPASSFPHPVAVWLLPHGDPIVAGHAIA